MGRLRDIVKHPSPSSCRAGKVKWNVEPLPSSDSTQILSAVALHDALADRQADTRSRVLVAGVEALEDDEDRSLYAGSMPMPLSATWNSAHPSCVVAVILTSGAASERNLTAFSIRFWNSWLSCIAIGHDRRQVADRDAHRSPALVAEDP